MGQVLLGDGGSSSALIVQDDNDPPGWCKSQGSCTSLVDFHLNDDKWTNVDDAVFSALIARATHIHCGVNKNDTAQCTVWVRT